ncbi:MAG: phage holin family protein [Bacteroidota bacterium]
MNFFLKLLLSTIAVMVASYILPGVHVSSFFTALVLALVLSILNVIVKPILIVLTIPLTIVTLGIFLLVINALIILIADALMGGTFAVDGFWWALLFSIVLSITNSLLSELSNS